MKFYFKFESFHSRKFTWICRLRIGGHFISASMWQRINVGQWVHSHCSMSESLDKHMLPWWITMLHRTMVLVVCNEISQSGSVRNTNPLLTVSMRQKLLKFSYMNTNSTLFPYTPYFASNYESDRSSDLVSISPVAININPLIFTDLTRNAKIFTYSMHS